MAGYIEKLETSSLKTGLKRFLSNRFLRFLFYGGTAASLNLLAMYTLVDFFGWESNLGKNASNLLSLELSLLYSFVVYRVFVWNKEVRSYRQYFYELLNYHAIASATIVTRCFLVFPLFDWLGVHHLVNTLIGIAGGCLINYFLITSYVFAKADEDSFCVLEQK